MGQDWGSTSASYFDATVSGLTGDEGKTTSELQTPTSYSGIYANWNLDLDNADSDNNPATGGDDPWDFGNSSQYPRLKAFADLEPTFGDKTVGAQSYTENTAIDTLTLPEATARQREAHLRAGRRTCPRASRSTPTPAPSAALPRRPRRRRSSPTRRRTPTATRHF